MKKTIAKIMAAAMVLSAVPAVALPTMTAEAATSVTMSTAALSDENSAGHYELDEDGNTGINLGKGVTIAYGTGSSVDATVKTDAYVAINSNNENAATGTTKYLEDIMKVSVDKDGYLILTVDTSVSGYEKVLANALYKGENAITLRIYSSDFGTASTGTTLAVATNSNYYEATWVLGGEVDSATKIITKNVEAKEGTLRSGDISIKLTNSSEAEVEVLKGDSDGVLDTNDALRGQTLDLTTVTFGGLTVPYKVVKIGAQALKKAHMKKVVAENVRRIGKGSLRKCKQVKHADFQDSNKIRKINGKAFYDCKNLNTIIIDGRKLKTVGKDAFHGVKKNCTVKIKAKKSKYESDKKMILKNGGNKNLKFVRK